ncbi:MAG TPA: hypothetical protein DIU15_19585, partial [Deltaproteobacteria bacterium]|nr:hypothetical protein [Deltaproteobacteria bacterium]
MRTDQSTPLDQATDASAALIGLIQSGGARVGVIGQGYVGLPLAMTMVSAGLDVTGYDIDQRKIDSLLAGKSYIDDVSDKVLQECLQSGRFHPRASFDDLSEMDAISICVPTPLSKTRDPDISFILTAAREVAERLR